jgi:hypothetical protein
VDVYLDPTAAVDFATNNGGYGFELSQATTDTSGNYYAQDNVFHVGAYDDGTQYHLGVTANPAHHATSGDNNDPSWYAQDAYNKGTSLYTVTEAGWYTFQYTFSEAAGDIEAINFSMFDDSGVLVYSFDDQWAYAASQMGGNSYLWFIGREPDYTDYSALQIDNVELNGVPEPAAMAILGLGALFLRKRKKA